MKILIIGGNGNIGYPISKMLSENKNNNVYILCRSKNHPNDQINYINGDGNNREFLQNLQQQEKFEIVVNFLIMNTDQAKMNIEIFKDSAKQFIFISTATVFNHEKNVVIDEKSEKFNIHSGYGQTKLECENIFWDAKEKYKFPVTIARPSQTYSRNRIPLSIKGKSCWSVISRIKRNKPVIVHGDGTSTWISTHSDDFASAFINLIGNSTAIGEDYNITGDETVNWNIIYNILAKELNKDIKIIHIPTDILKYSKKYDLKTSIQGDKQYSVIFDNSKIKSISPDFICNIDIHQGIKKYLLYMKDNPELQTEDPEFDKWCDKLIEEYEKLKDNCIHLI